MADRVGPARGRGMKLAITRFVPATTRASTRSFSECWARSWSCASRASNRDCYAQGALLAAEWLVEAAGAVRDELMCWDCRLGFSLTRSAFDDVVRLKPDLRMAKCDEGYLCDVCGQDVAELKDSDLYLRYIVGLLDPEVLHTTSERHIRCNPTLAQYIVADDFEPVVVEGPFDKRQLDAAYVAERERLITRGWKRLREVASLGVPIIEYPLPEVLARIRERSLGTG